MSNEETGDGNEFFGQVDRDTLNQIHDEIDYGVKIEKEDAMKDMNMVVIGQVDAGKSTLMGHILHKTGQIGKHEIRKNIKLAE